MRVIRACFAPSRDAIRVESSQPGFQALTTGVALLGDHQRDNATTAVATLHALQPHFAVPSAAIQRGLTTVDWPGRLQVLSERPLLVVDGAHNAASADAQDAPGRCSRRPGAHSRG